MPLVRGGYPVTHWSRSLFGNTNQSAGTGAPARTNLIYPFGNITDGAIGTTGVSTSVAVPVEWGDVISKITVFVGATAEGTGTHSFLALYSGIATPALLAQSADDTGAAALGASAAYGRSLATAVAITPTNAPYGFVYATVNVTASQIPTLASMATPTAVGYQLTTNGPLFFAATHGSAQGATAAATIASPTAFARAPIVLLS